MVALSTFVWIVGMGIYIGRHAGRAGVPLVFVLILAWLWPITIIGAGAISLWNREDA